MYKTGNESLAAVQNEFFDYILGRSDGALGLIVDDEKVGAEKRMNIYHNAYRASLAGVLADHFERVYRYIGDAQFNEVARAYIANYPSKVRNLRYYGESFPAFLSKCHPRDPELAELAQIDWHLRYAFDAADEKSLDAVRIGALGEEWTTTSLSLHPTATLMRAQYNIIAIWTALDRDDDVPDCTALTEALPILVWRNEMQPHFRSLSHDEATALALLEDGTSFDHICEHIAEISDENAAIETLSRWLALWLADGVIIENRDKVA